MNDDVLIDEHKSINNYCDLSPEPPITQGIQHLVRVPFAAKAAIITGQAPDKVTFFPVKIMAQDSTTKAQVCTYPKEIVIGFADFF